MRQWRAMHSLHGGRHIRAGTAMGGQGRLHQQQAWQEHSQDGALHRIMYADASFARDNRPDVQAPPHLDHSPRPLCLSHTQLHSLSHNLALLQSVHSPYCEERVSFVERRIWGLKHRNTASGPWMSTQSKGSIHVMT